MDEEYAEDVRELAEAVDEACVPALEEAVASHLPAIRAALRNLDAATRPSTEEIIERMRLNGLDNPEPPASARQ